MNRTKIIAAGIVVLLLATGAAIYFSMNHAREGVGKDTAAQGTDSTDRMQEDIPTQEDGEAESDAASVPAETLEPTPEPLKTEEIKVVNNSPEYDLSMVLTEDSLKKTSLALEYYYEGSGVVKTFDSTAIPEIEGIFENRAGNDSTEVSYRIVNAYLNVKLARVYFIVNGKGNVDSVQSDMYVIALADAKMKKIFSNMGKYGAMAFSKDGKYLGYSYNAPAGSKAIQESSFLEVIDCNTDELVIKNSRTKDGKIGTNMEPEAVYDYTFTAWYSNNTVRLKQKPVSEEKAAEAEVLYDISRNLILDKNGNVISFEKAAEAGETTKVTEGTKGAEGTEAGKPSTESTALKTLKDFYACLGSENDYPKAMELLDDSFSIKLAIFKQFGISELTKSDITAKDATMFSDMLKAASFDTVVSEESGDEAVTIYYYQNMALSTENQVRQPMSARVQKVEKGWKITLLQDADDTKPPFKSS